MRISSKDDTSARKGKLFVVGIGPGDERNMTLWARECLEKSEVIIGYRSYISLIKGLITKKEIIETGMTEEIRRAQIAIERAREGATVSVISSGDAGIYGMAPVVYELLLESNWKMGDEPDVRVVPGVTAASACASLVGAPLSADFAVISISDLLTPWSIIEKRVRGAASGDFVIVIYNPQSKERKWQIRRVRDIIMEYRSPQTPVAVIKNAFRDDQRVEITTLEDLPNSQNLGMITTIIVGNSMTIFKNGVLLTPRGYPKRPKSKG